MPSSTNTTTHTDEPVFVGYLTNSGRVTTTKPAAPIRHRIPMPCQVAR